MRTLLLTFFISISFISTSVAQDEILDVLASGVDDAQTFTQDYLSPSTDALINNLSANWYNSGEVKKKFGFEISVIANASQTSNSNQSFNLNTADYQNLSFSSGPSEQSVATVLGENNPDVFMLVNGANGNLEIELPQGLASEGVEFVPSAFIQVAVGLPLHTEVKFRLLPEVNTDDVNSSLYGFGLQHEFSKWVPFLKQSPLALSGFVGYTNLKSNVNVNGISSFIVDYDDQLLDVNLNSWHFAAITSTKWPIFNIYGSLGYVVGEATSALKGTYEFNDGTQEIIDLGQFKDPFEVNSSVSTFKATAGVKLKLGFFRLNAEYSLQEFNTLSVGVNFGFR